MFAPLAGKPVLAHTLHAFQRCDGVDGVVLVGPSGDDEAGLVAFARDAGFTKPLRVIQGGATRQESVWRGLLALPDTADIVAIHDAARPLITPELIQRTVEAARADGAALAVAPVVDTLKAINANGFAVNTVDRDSLRAAQTPQTFRVPLIRAAHDRARSDGVEATDDAALVERLGHPVRCVEGDRRNLKITTPEDLFIAEAVLAEDRRRAAMAESQATSIPDGQEGGAPLPRIGFGYDIHRLVPGRRLVLGGVEIPHSTGLDGHSDADVLLHAAMDALLGAAGLPDIGHLFPNTEERWRGASSRALLREVMRRLHGEGYRVGNLDVTLIAERPKIAPYIPAMRQALSEDLGIPPGAIGLKATTNEGVGALGREEAIAAHAVALIVRRY